MQSNIYRFLEITNQKELAEIEKPRSLSFEEYIGNVSDCILFKRNVDIEDMEKEEDETYQFSTPDRSIQAIFNRFETRHVLAKLNTKFDDEKIDLLVKMAWNFPQLVINKKTGAFQPFTEKSTSIFSLNFGSYPPRKVVYKD